MQDLARLSSLAEAEIDALRADGIEPSPAEIVMLNALGWAVETPETRRALSRGNPVRVGGATLWPMTIKANDWHNRVGCSMRGNRMRTIALAYAMAYGSSEGDELEAEGKQAERAVSKWYKNLRCTWEELNVAMAEIINQDSDGYDLPKDETSKGMTLGDFVASLVAMTGISAPFWERRCCMGHALAVLTAIVEQNKEDNRPSGSDPRIRAERALGFAVERIRNRSSKRNG
jgi:hypothetical protein